jgi:hypothetical protein
LLQRGLAATATLWPEIYTAFAWVHQAAVILEDELPGTAGQRRLRLAGLLGAMSGHGRAPRLGTLGGAVAHFIKVTRSYWPGLFHCYEVADLPRTNNALEQMFGAHRYHERRASGRKGASPALVLRGAARVIAATATRERPYTAKELASASREEWQQLRQELDARRHKRTERTRFRRDPQAFLSHLEQKLLQSPLPT